MGKITLGYTERHDEVGAKCLNNRVNSMIVRLQHTKDDISE